MAYRSATNTTGSSDSVTINLPSGVVDGDWLVYIVGNEGETVTWPFTPAATAAITVDGDTTRTGSGAVAIKLASSEPANRTITIGGGNGAPVRCACVAISGRSSSTPSLTTVTNDAGAGTGTVSTPLTGVTAVAGDDIVIATNVSATNAAGSWAFTAPASYTKRAEAVSNGTFFGGGVAIATRDNVGAGATGTLTGSWVLASTAGETCGVVIQFAASGGGAATGRSRIIGGKLVGGILVR